MNKYEPQIESQDNNKFTCQELDELVNLSILYDFYGELLNDHKKRIFEDYILNDLSLSEIAKEQGISRQGVYDIVKRCSLELKEYERRLSLVKRFQAAKVKLEGIKEITSFIHKESNLKEFDLLDQSLLRKINEIESLADEILKEL